MITHTSLCGVTVWYNPVWEYVQNIASYAPCLAKLFVIDNSQGDNSALLAGKGLSSVEYVPVRSNRGIAAALNIGCKLALDAGAEWILTMDQDSRFFDGGMDFYLQEANRYGTQESVGMFGPRHVNDEWERKEAPSQQFEEKADIWTSGALLNAEAYRAAGAFREDFFMDAADVEYSFRLRERKYKIIMACRAELHHVLGRGIIKTNFFGAMKYLIDDPPQRKYYICRNMLYCGKLYPEKKAWTTKYVLKQIKKTLLYDHQRDKWQKLRYMLKAILHYRRGITGQLILNEHKY
jgi:rhamnosyltransferase